MKVPIKLKVWDPNEVVDPIYLHPIHRMSTEKKTALLADFAKRHAASANVMRKHDKRSRKAREAVWIMGAGKVDANYTLPHGLTYGMPKRSKRDAALTRRGFALMRRLGFRSLQVEVREATINDLSDSDLF